MKRNSDNKLKEIDTEKQTCNYFADIINTNDLNLDNIILNENSYKNA